MPTTIDRDDVARMVDAGVQLVEVLPADEYERLHLRGAVSLPLAEIEVAREALDPEREVILYCYDYQCDLSARAAWRLEDLGFSNVYCYQPGKADWSAQGWPVAGQEANEPTAGSVAQAKVPTCRPDERVVTARERSGGDGDGGCLAVNNRNVFQGLVRHASSLARTEETVAEVMEPEAKTFRPDASLDGPLEYMRDHGLESVVVTTGDGVMVGLLTRDEIEAHLRERAA